MKLKRPRLGNPTLWILLLLGALLSGLANWSLQSPLPVAGKRAEGADHSFIKPHALLFDKDGQPVYEAEGTRLEHRAESGDYVLEQARFTVHPGPERVDGWLMTAERVRFLADRDKAMLEGAVKAERQHVLPKDALTLTTRDIMIDLNARTASGRAPMLAEGQHWQSAASAFSVDFSTQQLTQEGPVHDRHAPPRR